MNMKDSKVETIEQVDGWSIIYLNVKSCGIFYIWEAFIWGEEALFEAKAQSLIILLKILPNNLT